jgi:hypothetical protein
MKKDILEHIIENVLLERVRKAIAVNASKKEVEQAKAGGAVAVATVKIKGKGSFNEITSNIFSAISATPQVGIRSKYAYGLGPDYYVYVYAKPLINVRKQRIPVWIYKFTKPFKIQGNVSSVEYEIYTGLFDLGESPMMSKTTFEEVLKKQDMWEQEAIKLQQLQAQEETEEDEKINTANAALAKRQEWLDQNDTENVTFPYAWHTYDLAKNQQLYNVYKETILDNVPYLYFYEKQNDIFFVMKRIDQFLPTIIKEQLKPNFSGVEWQKLWDQIDISTVTPEENTKLQAIYQKEK